MNISIHLNLVINISLPNGLPITIAVAFNLSVPNIYIPDIPIPSFIWFGQTSVTSYSAIQKKFATTKSLGYLFTENTDYQTYQFIPDADCCPIDIDTNVLQLPHATVLIILDSHTLPSLLISQSNTALDSLATSISYVGSIVQTIITQIPQDVPLPNGLRQLSSTIFSVMNAMASVQQAGAIIKLQFYDTVNQGTNPLDLGATFTGDWTMGMLAPQIAQITLSSLQPQTFFAKGYKADGTQVNNFCGMAVRNIDPSARQTSSKTGAYPL